MTEEDQVSEPTPHEHDWVMVLEANGTRVRDIYCRMCGCRPIDVLAERPILDPTPREAVERFRRALG
jgi:hypothetical protein